MTTTNINDFKENNSFSYGSFCSWCNETLSGDFPRTCSHNHITRLDDKPGVVILQPVALSGNRTGLITVKRNVKPFIGGVAMVTGHKNSQHTLEQIAHSEVLEETGILYNAPFEKFKPCPELILPPSDPDFDERCFHIVAFEAPKIGIEQVDFSYTDKEVQEVNLMVYDQKRKTIRDWNDNPVALCFKYHERLKNEFFAMQENKKSIFDFGLMKENATECLRRLSRFRRAPV